MALAHSASAPGILSGRSNASGRSAGMQSRTSLRSAGVDIYASGKMPTSTSYEKMKKEGKFTERFPQIPPACVSTVVPLADSAERDVQPDIYFPAPPTPIAQRKYRGLSHGPGEIHVHYGLKEQRLPHEDFRYGQRGVRGCTAADTLKAGMMVGVAEYKNSVAERIYESTKREPLGKPAIRGHNLKMLEQGYGNPSGEFVDAKKVIFPIEMPQDTESERQQYKISHNNYLPGERICRNYSWPDETKGGWFKFGVADIQSAEGEGSRMALNSQVEDDDSYKRTRIVMKVNEDYRNVQHPKIAVAVHPKQGSKGPPMPHGHRYGIKSMAVDVTAGSCIKGYYELEDQLPDQDLGVCTKPGRRNVSIESRAFGCPSVRTDVPGPAPGKKSCADPVNYGDEPGAAALLNPQRFDSKGVPDSDFLIRRPRDELRDLIENCPYDLGEDVDFDDMFDEAQRLFDDDMPLVSIDAMLYLHTDQINQQVGKRHVR